MQLKLRDDGSYTCLTDPGEPTTCAPRVSVTDEEARLLAALAHCQNVLEIGTGLGVSTRALAVAAAQVVTVDPDPWVHKNTWTDIRLMFSNVQYAEALECLPDGPEFFDVCFIDGDHHPDSVSRDIEAVLPLLNRDGFIVLHDAGHPNILHTAEKYGRVLLVPTHHGMGLLWKSTTVGR